MPQSEITTWLEFAMQQMAAESYFHDVNINNRDDVKRALTRGNNDPTRDPHDQGRTIFTEQLADRFLNTYEIVDHHANDATGKILVIL